MIWSTILSFLGGPLINGLLGAYQKKLDAAGSRDGRAVELAKAEIEAEIETRRQVSEIRRAEGPWGPTGLLMFGFGLVALMYFGKCVVWDTMLGWGTTPAIRGITSETFGTIVQWLFGSGTVLSVSRMLATRLGR